MISWLIEQTQLITLLLVTLILSGSWLNKKVGPGSHYGLWLLVPVSVCVNSLDFSFGLPQNSFATFLVSAKEQAGEMAPQVASLNGTLVVIWAIGLIIMISSAFVMHLKSANVATDEHRELSSQLSQLSSWEATSDIKLRFGQDNVSPYVEGVLFSRLVLPSNFLTLFDQEQQRLVLKHELVHIKRRDVLWNLLALILLSVFWFNPICWWGYHRFRLLQELSCDQVTLKGVSKPTRLHYAKALLTASTPKPIFTLNQLTFGEKNMLKERLTQLKVNKPSSTISRLVVALSILTLGTVLTLANAKVLPASDQIKPIMRVNPKYPVEAAEKGIEGIVRMSFDVDSQGSVSNINVIGSIPEGVFDRNAKLALSQWQYANPTGETISAEVQLDFVLSAEPVEKIEVTPISALFNITDSSDALGVQFVSPYSDFLLQSQRVSGTC